VEPPRAGELLDGCTGMMDTGERPQVLLCVTARFRRVSWKYEGMAYAMVQKEVGVLYEALYLAATAMRLAPCALGGGDTALVTRALALDPLEEGPVGEFVLGSLP
jgi:SagB-type dehydrogenase family enzyme